MVAYMHSGVDPKKAHFPAALAWLLCLPLIALAGPPDGYYDSVIATNSATLRTTLHAVIDDHLRFPYTSGSTDTWDILELADQDPSDAGRIIDVYRNASILKFGGGNGPYNREHTWPKSFGFPDNTPGPYTDCHHLFLCDPGYNTARSNHPYRTCSAACSEKTTLLNNGRGGGSGVYPGNSSCRTGSNSTGTWETWIGRRALVAHGPGCPHPLSPMSKRLRLVGRGLEVLKRPGFGQRRFHLAESR